MLTRSKSLVRLSVAVAHRHPEPETLAKIVACSGRRDLRPGVCHGRVFWGRGGGRVGLGQSVVQYRRSGAQSVIGVFVVADFRPASNVLRFAVRRLVDGSKQGDSMLPLIPAPGACSRAAQEYSIS